MPNQSTYEPNSNPLAPSWRLAQYSFPEVASGYVLQKATYFSNFSLAPLAAIYNQEMAIDRASDFIWREIRFALINVDAGLYPNVLVRLRDSRGRRITNDFCDIQHIAGMLVIPMTFLAGTSMYIDAQADDSQVNTIQFQLAFKGFKRFKA
jgi:hypothetical protein